jgi:glycogen debranching enzyme
LITLSEYARWSGDLELVRRLFPHVNAALEWMRAYGDLDGDGFLEYQSSHGLTNQGWKDSTDSVRFRDGRLAQPPIALVEVQGYQYQALVRVAELAEHIGRPSLARDLLQQAATLRKKIAEAFWMEDRRTFAEALDGQKHRVDSLTSNPAHLLWCDAVDAAQASAVAEVLLSDEMFSGYGVRTLGALEGGYNPLSYHNGSVWPHDCSLALASPRDP